MTAETYGNGEIVFIQGDVGDKFYIVRKGFLHVLVRNSKLQDKSARETSVTRLYGHTRVAELGTGNSFGEIALQAK